MYNQSVDSVNNKQIEDHVNTVDNENAINPHLGCTSASLIPQYHPQESFKFPKILIGKRERCCQHNWFKEFKWLLYDAKKDYVFCYYCMIHEGKLTAEHNKDPAYISNGFRNWKKAPKCFKEHEQSKCHSAALTYQVVVPKCGEAAEMNDNEILNRRYNERQYLKIIIRNIYVPSFMSFQPLLHRFDKFHE